MRPPLHQSLPHALAHFQHNTEDLSRQYETVLQQEVDERDQGICERIISNAESLLTDKTDFLVYQFLIEAEESNYTSYIYPARNRCLLFFSTSEFSEQVITSFLEIKTS